MNNYRKIEYLKTGNDVQQAAYKALHILGIFDILKTCDPILVGTIPLAIDIPASDLDIVCQVHDFDYFIKITQSHLGTCKNYRTKKKSDQNGLILMINFEFMDFEFEIYATPAPVESSNGYRHMIIESRILDLLDQDFQRKVIELKLGGLKTEPAFAKLLDLRGDPYKALLALERMSDQEICALHQNN